MINVVSAVSTSAAIKTPALIDRADSQLTTVRPSIGFRVFDLLAGILSYLPAAFKMGN